MPKKRRKKRGRPATGHDPLVPVRLPKKLIRDIDTWAEVYRDTYQGMNRSTAIRCLLLLGLEGMQLRVIDPKDKTTFEGATLPTLKWTGTAALAAMSNKIANASMFPSPTADEAVARGFAVWLINNTRGQDPDLKEFLHAVVYVRPDYLGENTDLCKRMVAALVKSSAWIRAQPVDEVAMSIRPFFTSLDEKVFTSAVGNVREAVIPDGKMTAAASEAYQKVLLMTGHLTSPVAFDAVFTNKYLPG